MNLVVRKVNGCQSCVAAHTVFGKLNGSTDDQIIELRGGHAPFDTRLDALVRFVQTVTESRGRPSAEAVSDVVAAGFTKANIIDIVILIGDKTVTNFLNGVTPVPIDFPLAPALDLIAAV